MKRMRRLTLDVTWTLCMKMWRWIAKQIRNGSERDIESLKADWLETHTKDWWIDNSCYFCERNEQQGGVSTLDCYGDCQYCPGKLVDIKFSCGDDEYHYLNFPLAFYAKLQKLHKIYKAKKK